MDHNNQMIIVNGICHAAEMVKCSMQEMISDYQRPSVVYRPKLSADGDMWCALLGDDLQSGVAGFGKTPAAAMYDFDANFFKQKPAQKAPLVETKISSDAKWLLESLFGFHGEDRRTNKNGSAVKELVDKGLAVITENGDYEETLTATPKGRRLFNDGLETPPYDSLKIT